MNDGGTSPGVGDLTRPAVSGDGDPSPGSARLAGWLESPDGVSSPGSDRLAVPVDSPDGVVSPVVGDLAPDFTAPDVHGASVSLAGLRGRPVLVVFVPFAFTPVCTDEAAALQQAWPRWQERGVQLLMISCDSVPTLRRWADEHQVGFDVLSDFWPHGQVARAYGAFSDVDGAADRLSALIDANGVLRWRARAPRGVARPVAGYQAAIDALLEGAGEGSRP